MTGLLLAATLALSAPTLDSGYAYRTLLIRAAPGLLLEVIDLFNSRMAVYDAAGEERPVFMRHSQGDQWDLMLLYPIGSMTDYWSVARIARRERAASAAGLGEDAFQRRLDTLVAWREEVFVTGPPLALLRVRDQGAGFYHIEMFVALAGRRDDLVRERRMENAFLEATGRPSNLIFTRIAGAAWDSFTIGFYRSLQHYAEEPAMGPEAQDAAARAAGFEGRSRIGTYLRTLIASHHDTLAGRAR
jgi:hypothetical protein